MYFVYILESLNNHSYYIGCTNDIERRIVEHNSGLSRYTKKYTPWHLRHTEQYATLALARKREKQIKAWKKRRAIENLIHAPIV